MLYDKGKFLSKEDLRNAGEFLSETTIIKGDYLDTLTIFVTKGNFIFLDLPYYPVGKHYDSKRRANYFFTMIIKFDLNENLTDASHKIILDSYFDYKILA